ncbi:hypothetical protein [Legionella waltersii]|uniref:Uncharacterized protein n=1 Tax=Legionella waltersii TaxID=66969 RepID=A0A0W1AMS7_9GAMM|nr:hypothetical protein [Legionella waltersii]KTD82560.1 hypothetical protein Lwal_0598 [Legionella waltersii]SNU94985.1 Uncharacterised protein [Legionella waltersii]
MHREEHIKGMYQQMVNSMVMNKLPSIIDRVLLKMPNKKRKVSLDDYVSCYHYFERAIQNN